MTPEEYDEEREYFDEHYEDYTNGNYQPLWKQKNNEYAFYKHLH